jgi:very-short-patch-repair endonuclease
MSLLRYKRFDNVIILTRHLRKNMTRSEEKLWLVLRRKSMGYKFLRQHPVFYRIDNTRIEFFIADFYCSRLKLIIEVDGLIHETRREYDTQRDAKLSSKGIIVVRIKNEELNDINLIIKKLIDTIKSLEQSLRL